MKDRIDKELVRRGLVPSRAKAQELIGAELVLCDGNVVQKASFLVDDGNELTLQKSDKLKYVSRGGLKLEKAILEFGLNLDGLTIMDIGSSTGGFCDCALRYGAKRVMAIDVGTNLLHESLRTDPRIDLHEQTNFKELGAKYFEGIDLFVCDVSFISLKQIISKIKDENVRGEIVCLIKPQFECGKKIADKYRGIILDEAVHRGISDDLISYFNSLGFYLKNMTSSPIRGGDGNIEYLTYFSNLISKNEFSRAHAVIKQAFAEIKA